MKHRIVILILCAALALSLFSGCSAEGSTASSTRPDLTGKAVSVVTTVFPIYDWTRQIIGEPNDRVALTLLLDKGADFHSYQPTVEDIYKISTCDLFLYVGGESDKWVPDALAQSTNRDVNGLCLLDALGAAAREEETPEGAQAEEEEEEGPAYDEHVWLSLRNAETLCAAICDALCAKDPEGESVYRANCRAYTEKLAALEAQYAAAVEAAPRKTLLFADRFPFLYLAKDYGLNCYAAFSGCSAEAEASFETVSFLVNKLDELELPCVMKIESSNSRLAETIISGSKAKNAQILELDSLQTVTAQGVAEGTSYLGVMEQNLEVLKTALN